MEKIKTGVIGLGNMGSGIAATLLRAGYDVTVFDIDNTRVAALADRGATAAERAGDLAQRTDVILVSLPNSRTTVDVIENDVGPAVRKGCTIIDLGTTLLSETRRIHQAFQARGVDFLDAPVSGGKSGAAQGMLHVFVAGSREAADRNWEILQALGGARLTYCGESGAGQITKVVNQLAMGLVDAAFIEAVAFGVAGGVDAGVLRDAVGGDAGFRQQFRKIAGSIAAGDGDTHDVKYGEFDYYMEDAGQIGFSPPMLSALYTFMKQFPEAARDNMNRPYPPLWSALMGESGAAAGSEKHRK